MSTPIVPPTRFSIRTIPHSTRPRPMAGGVVRSELICSPSSDYGMTENSLSICGNGAAVGRFARLAARRSICNPADLRSIVGSSACRTPIDQEAIRFSNDMPSRSSRSGKDSSPTRSFLAFQHICFVVTPDRDYASFERSTVIAMVDVLDAATSLMPPMSARNAAGHSCGRCHSALARPKRQRGSWHSEGGCTNPPFIVGRQPLSGGTIFTPGSTEPGSQLTAR